MQLANTQKKAFTSACVISCITTALQLAVSNITLAISPNMTDHFKKPTIFICHETFKYDPPK